MPSVKAVLVTSLSCVSTWLNSASHSIQTTAIDLSTFASSTYHKVNNHYHQEAPTEVLVIVPPEFKAVLSSLPQASLHSVLHAHLPNFKDGIFEKDHKAVEEIYKRSPEMAKQLLAAARYDVLRRQNGNITTTSRPAVSSTGTPVTLTTTNAQGSTYLTTFTPVGGVFTSQVVLTSTAADGSPTTFTSLTVVPAPTKSASSGSQPSLQNDAAPFYSPVKAVTLSGVLVLAISIAGMVMA